MKVININGISQGLCGCGSWLDHWKNFSGQPLSAYCAAVVCFQKPEVGAHVQKADSLDNNWYIIPLCNKHNALTGQSLDIVVNVRLVSADVSETCGKEFI